MVSNIQAQEPRVTSPKILVCGAYSTGKTTLCRALIDHLQSKVVDYVGEVARRCPYPLNRQQTPLTSAWLFGEQIRSESEGAARSPDLVLCDRGIPDILSHTVILDGLSDSEVRLRDVLLGVGKAWCKTYDIVYWSRIDPGRNIQDDGWRVMSKDYQATLERAMEQILHLSEIVPVLLPASEEDRLALVMNSLQAVMNR